MMIYGTSNLGLETDKGRSKQFSGGRNARGREFQKRFFRTLDTVRLARANLAGLTRTCHHDLSLLAIPELGGKPFYEGEFCFEDEHLGFQ